jgi:hypothetical protein
VLSGYLNSPDLEKELKMRVPAIIPLEIQDFTTLLHYKFRELSDDDFEKLTENVLKHAKDGKYSIYDYPQIASFFYFFSENKLISQTVEEIEHILLEGLNVAKDRKEINDRLLDNLFHFGDDNPKTTEIKKVVSKIHSEVKKDEYKANSMELIDCLNKEDEHALDAIFDKHKFSKELFQYCDDKLLFDAILQISNSQIFYFTERLRYRYKIGNIGEFLFEDNICLGRLKDNLSLYLDQQADIKQLRKYLYSTLETLLLSILQHLNNTRKK